MQKIAPRRRLKRFTEVTGKIGVHRQIRRLAEAMGLTKPHRNADGSLQVSLNYFTMLIPIRLSEDEKMERLSEMVDTISAIEESSDVMLLGMWLSPTTE